MSTDAKWQRAQLDGSGDLKMGRMRSSNTFAAVVSSAAGVGDGPGVAAGGAAADSGDRVGEVLPQSHSRRGRPPHASVVAVEADALGHHLHVRLVQAGVAAVGALLGAPHAGVDTRFELLVSHRRNPLE